MGFVAGGVLTGPLFSGIAGFAEVRLDAACVHGVLWLISDLTKVSKEAYADCERLLLSFNMIVETTP